MHQNEAKIKRISFLISVPKESVNRIALIPWTFGFPPATLVPSFLSKGLH